MGRSCVPGKPAVGTEKVGGGFADCGVVELGSAGAKLGEDELGIAGGIEPLYQGHKLAGLDSPQVLSRISGDR